MSSDNGELEVPVGYSIAEARDADGKRKVQKRENRIFDMLPESKMTFNELTNWYLGLNAVNRLRSFKRVEQGISNFNREYGNKIVSNIKPVNIEDYQTKRAKEGMAPATIDLEVTFVKTMINKAFDNDMIDGRPLKAFRRVKKKLKKGTNARKRTLSIAEYLKLLEVSPDFFKPILKIAYNTGMRGGEIRKLKWSHIDRKAGFIRLPAGVTKEGKHKDIPINYHVKEVLLSIPKNHDHDFVFTRRGKPIRMASSLSEYFQSVCKKAGIPSGRKVPSGVTFHDIRRTVKTNMLNAVIDKTHRNVILGHAPQGMDVHYIYLDEDTLKEIMKKYTRWLDDQIEAVSAKVDYFVDQTGIEQS